VESTGTNNNIVEDNTILGNSNGLYLTAGVQGNIIRRNLIAGNPGVQTDVDSPSDEGADILNQANAGDNVFVGNVCMTAVNAPCSPLGPTLTANPNPIPVMGNAIVGQTTISWSAPDSQSIEIHIGSPNGPLFTFQGNRGSIQTGVWVSDSLTFYLQDVTGGNPLTSDYTLATLVVNLQKSSTRGATLLHFGNKPHWWAGGAAVVLMMGLCLSWFRRGTERRWMGFAFGSGALLGTVLLILSQAKAQSQPSAQQTAATLDRMIAAHKTQRELAQYVFDTHGCRTCHTVGQDGKLGFTARGEQAAGNFEGCIRLLTDMNLIARTREAQRSNQQRQKAARFAEFGCTFCHKVDSGKIGLTEVGAKLTHLHLGCVDVEKQVASGTTPRSAGSHVAGQSRIMSTTVTRR